MPLRTTPRMSYRDCARSRALAALDAYRKTYRDAGFAEVDHEDPAKFPAVAAGLVSDLGHLAEAYGIPFGLLLRLAAELYDSERAQYPETAAG